MSSFSLVLSHSWFFTHIFQKPFLKTSARNYSPGKKYTKPKNNLEKGNPNNLVMWSTTPSIVKKLQPTIPPLAKRLATFSLFQSFYEISSEWLKTVQFVGAIGVHWLVPVLLLLNFSSWSGERRLMTWPHSNRFYKKTISSHCFGPTKGKLFTL